MSGGSVGGSVPALRDAAKAFRHQAPVVARLTEIVTASQNADTGGGSLNGLVERLVADVASSLAGFGVTVLTDYDVLITQAEGFHSVGHSVQGTSTGSSTSTGSG